MPRRQGRPREYRRTVVLDADGPSKLARRNRRVRQMVRAEVEQGSRVVVPPLAVIQARAEGVGRRAVDDVIAAAHLASVDATRIELAARLLTATQTNDLADALVAAEALLAVPAIVITSDPVDIRRLLATDPRSRRIQVWSV